MPPKRQTVEPADALTVLIESFDYFVYNLGESGAVLVKETSVRRVIHLPYNLERIPRDIMEYVLDGSDVEASEFWAKLDEYLTTP